MKIETLKSRKKKYFLCALIVGVVLLCLVNIAVSKAKYRMTQSIKIAEGTIKNYSPADFNFVAIKLKNENGEYINSDTIPTSGYKLNTTDSYCGQSDGNGNMIKDNNVNFEYRNGSITVSNLMNKGTKCYFYFDKSSKIKYVSGYNSNSICNYTYSTDGGTTWLPLTYAEADLELEPNTMVKGSVVTYSCQLNFCSTENCGGSSIPSDAIVIGKTIGTTAYTITGSEVSYSYNIWLCFTKETMIVIYDEKEKKKKKKKVKDIKIGDKVYSYDENKNKYVYAKVTKIEVVKSKEVYSIHLKDNEVIRCSEGHSFYTTLGFIMAKELKPGYKILGLDNEIFEIEKVEREYYPEEIDLYNIYLEKNNNCFVSNLKIMSYLMSTSTAFMINKPKVEASPSTV